MSITITKNVNLANIVDKLESKVFEPMLNDLCNGILKQNLLNIKDRKKPDGSAQQANAPSTLARKGRGKPPLWGLEGKLKDHEGYRIFKESPTKFIMKVPADRELILGYVRLKGYEYWEIPERILGMDRQLFIRATFAKYFKAISNG